MFRTVNYLHRLNKRSTFVCQLFSKRLMTYSAPISSQLKLPTIDSSLLFLCDIQKGFSHLPNIERVVISSKFLASSCYAFGIPVIATEQYPKAFGNTRDELLSVFANEETEQTSDSSSLMVYQKTQFSMVITDVNEYISDKFAEERKHVIITGIEAHICILQTTLDLLNRGYAVHLCVDAVDSVRKLDMDIAIRRLESAGANLTTTESVVFQLLRDAKHPKFKEVQKFIKQHIIDVQNIEIEVKSNK